ncbi:MAG: FtsK/SpoIIIE domain-containing protein [Polyangia bacterium]
MRSRNRGDDPEKMILEALGAGEPLWRREWIAEEDLEDLTGNLSEVAKALNRLARNPDVLLNLRTTPNGRYWLLKRAGRVVDQRTDSAEEERAQQPPKGPVPEPVPQAEPPTLDADIEEEEDEIPDIRREVPAQDAGPYANQIASLWHALEAVGVRVVEIDPNPQVGPAVIQHRVLLGSGERIDTLRRRAEDISREVGCDVMISQFPGQRHVAVDFPRPDRQIVPLAPAIAALPKEDVAPGLWMPVGVTPAGQGVSQDLSILPHILLAGASGTGKTVAEQVAVVSLAMRLTPDQLEIVIIDPKAIDFSPFASLPHLRGGRIVTEAEEAINVLRELTGPELAERTRILQDARCPNIRELRVRRPDLGVKHIVVVIDEYPELVTILPKTEREEFERQILRLAQRARAVGIHMIIATQRPTTEFVTGAVKANLPTRISFRLPQRVDSMTIIDQPGAENLLGAGDMLLLHEGRLQRLQGYFVSMDEIATLVTELAQPKERT